MLNRGVGLLLVLTVASACASTVSQPPPPFTADAATLDTPDVGPDVPNDDHPPRDVPDSGPSRLNVRSGIGHLRRLNGDPVAWGDDSALLGGMLTDAGVPPPGARTVPPLESRLLLGYGTACTFGTIGELRCWGRNELGQVGNGRYEPVLAPGSVILDEVIDVASNMTAWCALKRDGSVWCWGAYLGSLSVESGPGPNPVRIDLPAPIVRLFGGSTSAHFNGVDASGRVWCWGGDNSACLVDQDVRLRGVAIPPEPDVATIALGTTFSCALSTSGDVRCWGADALGLEPIGSGSGLLRTPTPAPDYRGAIALSAGGSFLCALMPSGQVICGGLSSYHGKLGFYEDGGRMYPPRPVRELDDVIEIGSSRDHNCALTRSDEVFCWGSNGLLSLGQPPPRRRSDLPLRIELP